MTVTYEDGVWCVWSEDLYLLFCSCDKQSCEEYMDRRDNGVGQ